MAHFDGLALEYYLSCVTTADGVSDAGKDYAQINDAFLKRSEKQKESQVVLRGATEAVLDDEKLVGSL